MNITPNHQVQRTQAQKQTIAIAATFTAEPIEQYLEFWMPELDIPSKIEFALYNQVFQQLLDPLSLLSKNEHGINIILMRFEDWERFESNTEVGEDFQSSAYEKIERNVQDLLLALKSAAGCSATPNLVYLCPASPTAVADTKRVAFFKQMEELMVSELDSIGNIHLMTTSDLVAAYPVETYYDPVGDKLGHVPYTPLFFSSLGTAIARKISVIRSAPHKVIVLDCDHTLWKGVCGEDGVLGIEIDPPRKALQEFMVAQHGTGMLICLCSKNNEEDVVEVFERRLEMPLRRDHIVSWRVNWKPKSENIRALAEELQLGLDSFIFIDDNPVECAEVQANCPEVLTLVLPQELDSIPRFLANVWAFDRGQVTEEDKQRTALYKNNIERERFREQSLTLGDFMTNLGLEIQISTLAPQHFARVSQLTQRTNQFNFTTVRRSEGEIQQLSQVGKFECLVVEVRDRFGDYGLVGVIIFEAESDAIKVDTFLLSCRVLGRGVEHRMLSRLAEVAQARGLSRVDVSYIPTQKNQPALNFLDSVGAQFKQPLGDGYFFKFPVSFAVALTYSPRVEEPIHSSDLQAKETASTRVAAHPDAVTRGKSERLSRIATELYSAEQVLKFIELQQRFTRPQLEQPLVAPRTETEELLVSIWARLLRVETVGIHDNFFELGGTSLLAVQLFAQIEKAFGKNLPLATLLEGPTVEQLASIIHQEESSAPWSSLVAIQTGGDKPPLFCPQGAGGNVIVYRDLAHYLGSDQPVYGLQARGLDGKEDPYTWIEEMAADYIKQIRTVQPEGPYFLAGFSSGGRVAFEMAQQLHAQGQQVALVAMFDTYGPGYPKLLPPIPRLLSLLHYAINRFIQLGAKEKLALILNKARSFKGSTDSHTSKATDQPGVGISTDGTRSFSGKINYLEHWMNSLSISILNSSPWSFLVGWHIPGVEQPLPSALQKVQEANLKATLAYVPQVYPGRVTLLRCIMEAPGHCHDPELGWGGLAAGGLEIHQIPGLHHDILANPHVKVLAEKLRACLDKAQADDLSVNHQIKFISEKVFN